MALWVVSYNRRVSYCGPALRSLPVGPQSRSPLSRLDAPLALPLELASQLANDRRQRILLLRSLFSDFVHRSSHSLDLHLLDQNRHDQRKKRHDEQNRPQPDSQPRLSIRFIHSAPGFTWAPADLHY